MNAWAGASPGTATVLASAAVMTRGVAERGPPPL